MTKENDNESHYCSYKTQRSTLAATPHNGWNPAVFRECLVGKTQAVVVVVVG